MSAAGAEDAPQAIRRDVTMIPSVSPPQVIWVGVWRLAHALGPPPRRGEMEERTFARVIRDPFSLQPIVHDDPPPTRQVVHFFAKPALPPPLPNRTALGMNCNEDMAPARSSMSVSGRSECPVVGWAFACVVLAPPAVD